MTTDPASALPYGVPPAGYRLPTATRLGPVRLQVADLGRSVTFYEGVLGFGVLEEGAGRATLGADAPLVELVERPGVRPVPRQGRLGLYHVAYLLPERAALGRFVRHLAGLGVRAGMSDHLVSEAVYLSDPDGLGIEVYADRPRAAWRHEGRQLAMVTAPLDVEALVRAAGGEPWVGVPAGTVVGHVHLHVGDLGEAARFYHDGLGLDRVVWSYPGALFLSAGGYHHHLGLNTWAAGAGRPGADDARLLDWSIVVPEPEDAEAAARSLEATGTPVAPEGEGWRATDPTGTTLRLVPAPPPARLAPP